MTAGRATGSPARVRHERSPTLRRDVRAADPPVRAPAGRVPPLGPEDDRCRAGRRPPGRVRTARHGRPARRQLVGAGDAGQERRRPRGRGVPRRHPGRRRRAALPRVPAPGWPRPVPADATAGPGERRPRRGVVPGPLPRHAAGAPRARRAPRLPRRAAHGPGAPRRLRGRRSRPSSSRRPTATRTSCTRSTRATSSRTRCTASASAGRRPTRRCRSRRAPRSGSWAAGSSGGCSGSRPARWATGSSPWTRTRRVRPRRSRTRSSSAPTTTRMPRAGWPAMSDVVTYELEHVGLDAAAAAGEVAPLRPGLASLQATRDRLAERRFIREIGEWAAPWREVRDVDDARAAADALGYPVRLKTRDRRLRRSEPGPGHVAGGGRGGRARAGWRAGAAAAPGGARSTSRPSSPSSAPATGTVDRSASRSPATSTTPGSSSRASRPPRSTRSSPPTPARSPTASSAASTSSACSRSSCSSSAAAA